MRGYWTVCASGRERSEGLLDCVFQGERGARGLLDCLFFNNYVPFQCMIVCRLLLQF